MAIIGDNRLHIYVLNVGQADTSVIITPTGEVVVIDAARPDKLVNLLQKLGMSYGDSIAQLVLTHPHRDHCDGANRLALEFRIESAVLSPFWNPCGMGSATYEKFVARLQSNNVHCTFMSGYGRWYPDGPMTTGTSPDINDEALHLEYLGPTNNLIESLREAGVLDTNHLSVMARLSWRQFRMIFAGDAQMENWSCFDSEGMMNKKCKALKAAHHGSGNGTQWERLHRLRPKYVIVPSDPGKKDHLPDVVGTSVFAKYSLVKDSRGQPSNVVTTSADTGTVRITIDEAGTTLLDSFADRSDHRIRLDRATPLEWTSNPTDWQALLSQKCVDLYS